MEQKKANVAGIISFILGLLGIFTICISIGWIPGIIGFILGIVGCCLKERKKGLAIAGLVLSIIAIILSGVVTLFGWAISDTEKDKEEAFSKEYAINESFEYLDEKITLMSVEDYISDNEFIQPGEGNKFIKLTFEFENKGDDSLYVSMYDFEVFADGYSVEQIFIDDDPLDATLSKDKKTKGSVCFEVPEGAESISVEYMSNAWTDDKVKFKVK